MLLGIRWGSLRNKIIAWVFVPMAIILIAVAWVNFYSYRRVTEDLVIERNKELARLSAVQLMVDMTGYTDTLSVLARTADIYGDDPTAQRDALKSASRRLAAFDGGVLIINAFGTVVAAEPERPEVLWQNWANRIYYRQMLRSQTLNTPGPVFSDIVTDGPEGMEVIVAAVPITDEWGDFVGVMAGMFRLGATSTNVLYDGMAKFRVRESGSLYLVDGSGRVIYHSDPDRIGDDILAQAVVQKVLNRDVGAVRTGDFEGRDIVASFAPVPGTAWGLVAEESWSALIGPSEGYRRFLLLLLALGVAVPTLVVTVGVGRITSPIAELIAAAQEVAGGKFDQTITAPTGDEVEELAEQFNLMSAQLQESYTSLERKVADRTKELATLNSIGASVNESLDLDETLNRALDGVLDLLDLEVGEIRLLDEESDELVIHTQRGLSPEFVRLADRRKVSETLPGRIVLSGEPVIEWNVFAHPRYRSAQQEGLQAMAILPLRAKEKLLGTLSLATRRAPRPFTGNERELLQAVSDQVGVAIENARLYEKVHERAEELEEKAERLALVNDLSATINSTLDLSLVLQMAVEQMTKIFNVERSGLVIFDYRQGYGHLVARYPKRDPHDLDVRIPLADNPATEQIIRTRQPLPIEDVQNDALMAPVREMGELAGIVSMLIVPLVVKDEVIGTIGLDAMNVPRRFSAEEIDLAQTIANQISIALENARLFELTDERLTIRVEQLAALQRVNDAANANLELSARLQAIIETTVQVSRVEAGTIYLCDEAGQELVLSAAVGLDPKAIGKARLKLAEGLTGWVARERQPLSVPDVTQDARHKRIPGLGLGQYRGWLGIPLCLDRTDQLLGVMNLRTVAPREFTAEEIDFLDTLAGRVSVAIDNARLFAESQRQLARLTALREIDHAISSPLTLQETLNVLLEGISQVLPADACAVMRVNPAIQELEFAASRGLSPEYQRALRLRVGESIAGRIAVEGQPISIAHLPTDPLTKAPALVEEEGLVSYLGVPLHLEKRVIGVLSLYTRLPHVFSPEEVGFADTLGGQAAIAIEKARLLQETQEGLARTTRLYRLSANVASSLSLSEVADMVVCKVREAAGARAAGINLMDVEGHRRFRAGAGLSERCQQEATPRPLGSTMTVMRTGQPVIVANVADAPESIHSRVQEEGIRAQIGLPLRVRERVIGAMFVHYEEPHAFSQSEVETLSIYANQAAIALENAHLFREANEQAEQLATLNELANTVSTILDLEEVLETIYRQTQRIIPIDAFFIALYVPHTNQLDYKLLYDEGVRYDGETVETPVGSFVEQVLLTRQPILESRDPDLLAELSLPERRVGNVDQISASLMYAPLISGEELVGVISSQSYAPYAYTPRHLELLCGVASHAAIAIHNARLFQNIRRQAKELATLNKMGRQVASILEAEQLLELVVALAAKTLHAGACTIYLIDPEEQLLVLKAVQGLPASMVKHITLRMGEGLVGWTAMEARPVRVVDARLDPRWKNKYEDEGEKITSLLSVPIVVREKTLGVIELFHRMTPFTPQDEALLVTLASQVGVALENARLYQDVRGVYLSTIRSLATAIDARDPYTKGHSEEVARYAVLMARELGWPSEDVERIEYAGLLHDAGKIGTPEAILRKPTSLNQEEWVQMRLHPFTSAQIIKPVRPLFSIVPWVYHHHERWDGRGYLDGLVGERIPLEARVLAVADTYSAITTDRPYRPARSPEDAVAELRRVMGSQLDPEVVKTFLEVLKRGG